MSKHRARIKRIESLLQPGDQFYLGEVWIGDQLTWTNSKPPPPGLKELEIAIGGPEMSKPYPGWSQDQTGRTGAPGQQPSHGAMTI